MLTGTGHRRPLQGGRAPAALWYRSEIGASSAAVYCPQRPPTPASRNSCHFTSMRRFVLAALFVLITLPSHALERWETLPPTPPPVPGDRSGDAAANGINLHYAVYGRAPPLFCCTAASPTPILGQSGSSRLGAPHSDPDGQPWPRPHHTRRAAYGYDLMADDVMALLDALHIPKADIVGWSDGAILGSTGLRHPDRVGRIFAFAANTSTSGVIEDVEENPPSPPSSRAPAANTPRSRRRPTTTPPSSIISKMWAPSPTGPTPARGNRDARPRRRWRPRRGDHAGKHRTHGRESRVRA